MMRLHVYMYTYFLRVTEDQYLPPIGPETRDLSDDNPSYS
jgi:hypothetical protein